MGCQVHKMKGCRCHRTDWTARAKQAVFLFLSLLGQCDSVIGQIGLDFLFSVSDKKNLQFQRSNFEKLGG